MKQVNVGFIGLGCRGKLLSSIVAEMEEANIVAVCDLYEDRQKEAAEMIGQKTGTKPKTCGDYHELLKDDAIDAVIIAASWEAHVPVAIDCMQAGKITALEVGGAYTVEDCYALVEAQERTGTPFMFLENCCYGKFELLSTSLVRKGMMGEIVHCHGAYGHDLRSEVLGGRVNRHYRLNNYITRNCENYPTHELGPIARLLGINRGNRMVSLVSVASKAAGLQEFSHDPRNPDPSLAGQKFAQGDIIHTLITCEDGSTISLKLDTTLPRFYSREFTVRGTKGCCLMDINAVLLDDEGLEEFFDPQLSVQKYLNNAEQFSEYLPKIWKDMDKQKTHCGHGGMDYLMLREFFRAVQEGRPMPIDIYDAAAWMVITPLSEQSIARQGAAVEIPDFTNGAWRTRKNTDIVEL
ncbi:MAG TPA: Gfo/Idh/MocA family oxidoreductase [Candidatus Gallimonas intestinavium]|uniref:Gfo/Idh/MocA family oxidoreductase n=1 Tax=Candidatus Gallimonas intestinavium TaxID=2838603 RepID=A0A9D2K078_9FIRM|nr:Gfo/Idh/MocA family oxidoreductase [Candidatus Gallimonas intestinavium]